MSLLSLKVTYQKSLQDAQNQWLYQTIICLSTCWGVKIEYAQVCRQINWRKSHTQTCELTDFTLEKEQEEKASALQLQNCFIALVDCEGRL